MWIKIKVGACQTYDIQEKQCDKKGVPMHHVHVPLPLGMPLHHMPTRSQVLEVDKATKLEGPYLLS